VAAGIRVSEAFIQSLISAGAGLLGALIGFGGALLVSIRAERASRHQARYARAHEHRDEVLGNIYGLIYDYDAAMHRWLDAGIEPEAMPELWEQALDLGQELHKYFIRSMVWVPDNIAKELHELIMDYEQLHRLMDIGPHEAEYEEARAKAKDWVSESGAIRCIRMESMIRDALGLRELDRHK
jgi:hypothetical protein